MAPANKSGTILVVDDEASVRNTIRRTLESQGYQVVEGAGNPQGLRITISIENGKTVWSIETAEHRSEHFTIYELLRRMRMPV